MDSFLLYTFAATGAVVWFLFAIGLLWLTRAGVFHAVKAWEMSGRIVLETKTETSRIRWWWAMFWHGPVTSMTTADDGHTVYWPGQEPAGWYGDTPPL
jgi:hypothetical protein